MGRKTIVTCLACPSVGLPVAVLHFLSPKQEVQTSESDGGGWSRGAQTKRAVHLALRLWLPPSSDWAEGQLSSFVWFLMLGLIMIESMFP